MTLDQLRVFIAVAEREHVTRAAEALHLTQSAVSAAIQALEAYYDVTLFHRVGRRIELTRAGALFLVEARAIMERIDQAEQTLVELDENPRGMIAIHASKTIVSYWLPRQLVQFQALHPQVKVRLSIGNSEEVASAVRAGDAELGFVEGSIDDENLVAQIVAQDQIVVVVNPDHPWAGRSELQPAELAQANWVLRERGSGTRSSFEAALAARGIDLAKLQVIMEMPSNAAICMAVEAGEFAGAVSESVVDGALTAGRLVKVAIALPKRDFVLLRHRQRVLSRAAEAFAQIFAEPAR